MFRKPSLIIYMSCELRAGAQMLAPAAPHDKIMMFADTTRIGVPFAKDHHVVKFGGRYLMYYSEPPRHGVAADGWAIGVAESRNLIDWTKVGEILPAAPYERNGLCAPCAIVRNDSVNLFYQVNDTGGRTWLISNREVLWP